MSEDLSVLKPGDEVAVREGYSRREYLLTRVTKITPTGQIVVGLYGMRFKDGMEMGSSGLHPRRLCLVTPEIRAAIARRYIALVNWDKVDDATIAQVVAILKTGREQDER